MLRKVAAEFVGTAFLLATVIGSGIMASQLSDDPGLQLLENSIATGAVLVALILTLQPVSAAFNPVVTAVEVALGEVKLKDAAPLVAAQFAGGFVGAVAANLMFELDAIQVASHVRDGPGMWLAEVIATFGLVIIIFGGMRAGRTDTIAFAVGGYIAAAYWFTSSTSFANPAVTVARIFSDTFAGIAPASVLMFVVMQVIGGVLAWLFVRLALPAQTTSARGAT
ncbi:aquaporin [Aeromicrobium sp.]|uniref:aquaporin n=1 Tax=Aeromicrobium sp. TaxID=1871063 RepID=UPI003C4CC451